MTRPEDKYKLSDSFNNFLIEISEGFLSEKQFNEVYLQFETNSEKYFFDSTAEANLFRILSAIFDKKTFLLDSLKYLHHIEIVCAISSLSNYLTDIVVRNPEYLYILFDQQKLTEQIDETKLSAEVKSSVNSFKTLSAKTRMLRNIKRKYLLKIGTADILGFRELASATEDLSALARVLSSVLFQICYNEVQKKYNVTLPHNYALCSLGKLGGNELNYSSDIDLIIFYRNNYEIESIKKDYHEIISESIQLFVQGATAVTAESYLYRVDFRLRPDGRNSLLCMTILDYIRYYETRGEDWERQMLIKLGFVAGDLELFTEFKNYINAFIYPKSLRSSVIEAIQRMKHSIESRLHDERNIKLIPGGIRDIEFSVQALQLMNGGKISKLKTGNTLLALQELLNASLISQNEYAVLTDAYIIYRQVEHFVQLMNDKQTHLLPESQDAAIKLALYLNFTSPESLSETIDKYRKSVRIIYESIVVSTETESKDNYAAIDFDDLKQARSNIKFLSYGLSLIGQKQFDKPTIKLFQEIEPALVDYLDNSIAPDIVLNNFVKIIRNSKLPSVWYSSFQDKLFYKSFLRICEFSQRAVDHITSSQRLADLFLSKKVFQKIEKIESPESLEDLLLILSVQHAAGLTSFPVFSEILFNKIKSIIISDLKTIEFENEFFIAGLGSFANQELSFGSDLDLVVVVDDLRKWHDAQKTFQDVLNKFKKSLTPFEVDFRLRPEGKSSPLVWDLSGYKKYINDRMRIWEFQALSKLGFIFGSEKLFYSLVNSLTGKLNLLDSEDIYNDVMKMYRSKLSISNTNRRKIDFKNSSGALLSVDTIISLMLLNDSSLYQQFINSNSIAKLECLVNSSSPDNETDFKENYLQLKNMQIALQNMFNQNKSTFPFEKNKTEMLAAYLGFDNSDLLISWVNSILKTNSSLLNDLREAK